MLCKAAQQASSATLQQGFGAPDLATEVAWMLLTSLHDDLSDTGYVEQNDAVLHTFQVRYCPGSGMPAVPAVLMHTAQLES